jgi:hypothetical protein
MSLTLGGTGYFYTDDLYDTPYIEANVGFGMGPLSLEYAAGKHSDGDDNEYSFISLGCVEGSWFATAGAYGNDFVLADVLDAGKYLEVGYGFSGADLDFSVSGLWNDSVLSGLGQSNLALIFGVSKTFPIQ